MFIAALAVGAVATLGVLALVARDGGSGSGNEVTMQRTAFVPATITIERGDEVSFVNQSGTDKWPASDVHPTHENYPGFDAKRPVTPDDSWSFTFERTGRWTYHDHLAPQVKGVIVVR